MKEKGLQRHFCQSDQHQPSREGEKGTPSLPLNPQEQARPQQESVANKLLIYLKESLGVNQPEGELYDVNIFATRVIAGLHVLEERIDRKRLANKISDKRREETCNYHEALGQKLDENLIHNMGLEKNKDEAYLKGLEDALKVLDAHILGKEHLGGLENLNRD